EHALVPALLEHVEAARAGPILTRCELYRADQAQVAAVDHVGQPLEGMDSLLELRLDRRRRFQQPFLGIGIEGRDARGAGERMAGIRISVEELDAAAGRVDEGLVDRVLHHYPAQRYGPRGDPLGESDEVRLDAEVLRG